MRPTAFWEILYLVTSYIFVSSTEAHKNITVCAIGVIVPTNVCVIGMIPGLTVQSPIDQRGSRPEGRSATTHIYDYA
jgi:hypothetical protein